MVRLINNKILQNLDFTYINICVDCIKGKQTKHTKKKATRSTQLFEIMHIDIYGPLDVEFSENKGTLSTLLMIMSSLLQEKSRAVDVLKTYLNEVEKQLDRKVKVVKSIKMVHITEGMMTKLDKT